MSVTVLICRSWLNVPHIHWFNLLYYIIGWLGLLFHNDLIFPGVRDKPLMRMLSLLTPPPVVSLQAVFGGQGPLLWMGLQAETLHHAGGQFQHEPVEAEHHSVSGESDFTTAFTANTHSHMGPWDAGVPLISSITCQGFWDLLWVITPQCVSYKIGCTSNSVWKESELDWI